eukprot:jgi/Psemu1/53464/gm1.53464_g
MPRHSTLQLAFTQPPSLPGPFGPVDQWLCCRLNAIPMSSSSLLPDGTATDCMMQYLLHQPTSVSPHLQQEPCLASLGTFNNNNNNGTSYSSFLLDKWVSDSLQHCSTPLHFTSLHSTPPDSSL